MRMLVTTAVSIYLTTALVTLLVLSEARAQVPAYDFYPDFRKWWFALPDDQRRPMEAVIERYSELGPEGKDLAMLLLRLGRGRLGH